MKLLKIFLLLITLHTFCVGLGLILIPLEYFELFGFENYRGGFFKVQAGVFHLVLCVAYVLAARDPVRNKHMVVFAIFAKFIATLFLFSYSIFIKMAWMVLVSGIADFLMGLILLGFYLSLMAGSARE